MRDVLEWSYSIDRRAGGRGVGIRTCSKRRGGRKTGEERRHGAPTAAATTTTTRTHEDEPSKQHQASKRSDPTGPRSIDRSTDAFLLCSLLSLCLCSYSAHACASATRSAMPRPPDWMRVVSCVPVCCVRSTRFGCAQTTHRRRIHTLQQGLDRSAADGDRFAATASLRTSIGICSRQQPRHDSRRRASRPSP